MTKIFCTLILAVAFAGVSFANENTTDQQALSCKCPPPPPPRLPSPGGAEDQDDMNAEGSDMPPAPLPLLPQDQNITASDEKARPLPPPPPPKGHHERHKGPKEICGTDGKTYADKCQFTNAQLNNSKLGERPCPPPNKPHCLNNGTTVNIDRKELDQILRKSPISLGVLCPGPCPCKLECPPPPPPPPKDKNRSLPPLKDKNAPPPMRKTN